MTPGEQLHGMMLSKLGRELRHRAMCYEWSREDKDLKQKYEDFAHMLRQDLLSLQEPREISLSPTLGTHCSHIPALMPNGLPRVFYNGANAYTQCSICGKKEKC